jgi:hypothetical protein
MIDTIYLRVRRNGPPSRRRKSPLYPRPRAEIPRASPGSLRRDQGARSGAAPDVVPRARTPSGDPTKGAATVQPVTTVQGTVEPGFEPVRDAFEGNFRERASRARRAPSTSTAGRSSTSGTASPTRRSSSRSGGQALPRRDRPLAGAALGAAHDLEAVPSVVNFATDGTPRVTSVSTWRRVF